VGTRSKRLEPKRRKAAFVLTPTSALGLAWLAHGQAKADISVNRSVIAPTTAQRHIVAQLGAHATWNRFGLPPRRVRSVLSNGYRLSGSLVRGSISI